jgi:hypothetical protein
MRIFVLLSTSGMAGVWKCSLADASQYQFTVIDLNFPFPEVTFEPSTTSLVLWSQGQQILKRYCGETLQLVQSLGKEDGRNESTSLLEGHLAPVTVASNYYSCVKEGNHPMPQRDNPNLSSPLVSGDELGIVSMWPTYHKNNTSSKSPQTLFPYRYLPM